MKESEDKNIEQYVYTVIKEVPLDSPSPDFTSKVMANVLALDKGKNIVYKPLISRKGWVLIFGGIVATMVYFIVNGTQSAGLARFGSGVRNFIKTFSDLHLFQFSRVTVNVIVLSTILILLQISLLKNYLNKRAAK